jgi:FKBP-type peptidyl-prolyl cis-trans isomerase SlyD|tara:strand:- start:857 stop:1561 length:705 start_codon:yes stop_codon:yes gene_type:complete
MTKIANNQFIELSYTGKTTDDDAIFDTTENKVVDEHHLHAHDVQPMSICVGRGHLIPGLDKDLVGKEIGKSYSITLDPEEAYGKKQANLIQLIPTSKFKNQEVRPARGMTVDIDGNKGIIKTTGGGRTLVDFNHPLAGREVTYDYTINKIITDVKDKIKAVSKIMLGIEPSDVTIKDGSATLTMEHDMPKEIVPEMEKQFKEHISEIKKVTFKKAAPSTEKEESLKTSPSTQEK